jgi:hypothetical protein
MDEPLQTPRIAAPGGRELFAFADGPPSIRPVLLVVALLLAAGLGTILTTPHSTHGPAARARPASRVARPVSPTAILIRVPLEPSKQ